MSNINALNQLEVYPKVITEAIEYLRTNDFNSMEKGVYEIKGRDMYAQVVETETKEYKEGKFETHKDYIDVQFLVKGAESIGFVSRFEGDLPTESHEERDLYFYDLKVENETILKMIPGDFAVFFPGDIHKPVLMSPSKQTIKKVVIKIHTKLL